jgi:hypothetical protein
VIKYLLGCASGHEFESWFRAGGDFDAQSQSGAISCPLCGSVAVAKQPMAPSVVTKRGKQQASGEPVSAPVAGGGAAMREAFREFKQNVIENTEDVGSRFADEARKMHFGDIEERNIRGSSTPEEARSLAEEGVPFGVIPALPEDLN